MNTKYHYNSIYIQIDKKFKIQLKIKFCAFSTKFPIIIYFVLRSIYCLLDIMYKSDHFLLKNVSCLNLNE